jgi:hypothetical protein
MDSILATEPVPETPGKQPAVSALETWSHNERMRHVPGIEWMAWKLDVDIRHRVEKLIAPVLALDGNDPRRAGIEEEFKTLYRALERFADVAKHVRNNGHHVPADLGGKIGAAISHAVTSARSNDADLIGRRFPFHTFERSKAEPLYAALLVVLSVIERIVPLVRDVDARLDERLLDGLVVLQNPVDDRMLRPIA